jgi:hypothetical protein
VELLRHDLIFHAIGEWQALGFLRIIARYAGAGADEYRTSGAGRHQGGFIAGELGDALAGDLGEIANRNVALRSIVHCSDYFRWHQRAAQVSVGSGGIDDWAQTQTLVDLQGIARSCCREGPACDSRQASNQPSGPENSSSLHVLKRVLQC